MLKYSHLHKWIHCTFTIVPSPHLVRHACAHSLNVCASNIVEIAAHVHQGRCDGLRSEASETSCPVPSSLPTSDTHIRPVVSRLKRCNVKRKLDPALVQALPSSIWVFGLFMLKEERYHKVNLEAVLPDLQLSLIPKSEAMLVNSKIIWHHQVESMNQCVLQPVPLFPHFIVKTLREFVQKHEQSKFWKRGYGEKKIQILCALEREE